MNQYGKNFGRFMAQHHDLQRAYKRLKAHYEKRDALMYDVKATLFMTCNILRLGGYTDAANHTHKLLEKIAELELAELEREHETPVAAR